MSNRLLAALLLGAAFCIRVACAQADMQPAARTLAYDVTTIKPHKPGENNSQMRWHDGTLDATNVRLLDIIAYCYSVKSWLVFGLPPWTESARYDIQGKVLDADPKMLKDLTSDQRGAMLAQLLKDRFGLQVHQETKSQPVFELSVMPEGSKLRESAPLPAPTEDNPKPRRMSDVIFEPGMVKATAMTVDTLAQTLSYDVERVILNKTGLAGFYDLDFKWTPEDLVGKEVDNGTGAATPPAIFTALKEQLGLKLTPAKAPVPTLVVDKIDPPQEN